MCKKRFIILSAVLLFLFSVCVYAHPGKTDSAGGHIDHSTGGYHYHHGHPAHDHVDVDGDGDPDCPYDFQNAESPVSSGRKSVSMSSGQSSPDSETQSNRYWIFSLIASFVIMACIEIFIFSGYGDRHFELSALVMWSLFFLWLFTFPVSTLVLMPYLWLRTKHFKK